MRTSSYIAAMLVLLLCGTGVSVAQNPYGTTGLLRMPTADMQEDKTFMFGNTYLPKEGTDPHRSSYDTFNYFFNITFFPWMEIAYTLTMNQGVPGGYWPEQTYGKFVNQDRSFHGKIRLWKEGDWKDWTPQIAVGANDPVTHSGYGGGDLTTGTGAAGTNNYLTRWYVAASKHLDFGEYGSLALHAAWVLGRAKSAASHYSRPAVGMQYRFQVGDGGKWWHYAVNGLSFMAEYDARTVNVGAWYDFPAIIRGGDGRDVFTFHAYLELNQCRYPTAGILFKVHLK